MRSTIDHPYPTTKIQWIPDQVLCECSIRVVRDPSVEHITTNMRGVQTANFSCEVIHMYKL